MVRRGVLVSPTGTVPNQGSQLARGVCKGGLIVGWVVNLRVGALGCGSFPLGGCGEECAVDSVD